MSQTINRDATQSSKIPSAQVSVPAAVGIEVFTATCLPVTDGQLRMKFKCRNRKVKMDSEIPVGEGKNMQVTWNYLCEIESDGKTALEITLYRHKKRVDKLSVPLKVLTEIKEKKIHSLERGTKILACIWIIKSRPIRLETGRRKVWINSDLDRLKYKEMPEVEYLSDEEGIPLSRHAILDGAFSQAIKHASSGI
eukprot:CFRG4688T1